MSDGPSATEMLREKEQLIKAYEAHMSELRTYIDNPDRWRQEMDREQKKLEDQQARVDRLRAYYEDGPQKFSEYAAKRLEMIEECKELRNRAAIEKLLRLTEALDALNGR